MSLTTQLGSRLYLDTNWYIYAFEQITRYEPVARKIFEYVANTEATIIASELVRVELLPKLIAEHKELQLQTYEAFLHQSREIKLVPVDADILEITIQLRAKYSLKTLDALHVATALYHHCTAFISNDRKIQQVKELPILGIDNF